MKIILLKTVAALGKTGDIKDVSDGYARNFLLPKKLAAVATETAVKNSQIQKEKELKEKEDEIKKLRGEADRLKGLEITLKRKDKKGKLFGSISAKDIAEALGGKGFEIQEKCITMKGAIKKTGRYEIEINLEKEISVKINLTVESEE